MLHLVAHSNRQAHIEQALLSEFDHFSINRTAIAQDELDLVNRCRTSLFPWRGQFSPEFVELMLAKYACSNSVVVDPFVGSGTVLFEAVRQSLRCFGAEINPAAVVMSDTVRFANLDTSKRREHIRCARSIIEKHWPVHYDEGLFSLLRDPNLGKAPPTVENLLKDMLCEATADPYIYSLIANTVIRFMTSDTRHDAGMFFCAFEEQKKIVEQLPFSIYPCVVFHCDARALPLDNGSVDLIITSPPYINVFNYHQNDRPAMELMGWDPLRVARSEFGSNRKHRGNRFLTVVQYAIDMLQALCEMRRLIRLNGRIIIVIGRESKVRSVSFQNGQIVAALAAGGAGLRLVMRQERKFKNKFGSVIYEDILHFVPTEGLPQASDDFARSLARTVLDRTISAGGSNEMLDDILAAREQAARVQASPLFVEHQNSRTHSEQEALWL